MLLYRIFYLPALLLGLPYYALRMWRRGGYRKGFGNRFGLLGKVPPKGDRVKRIWIQAVSVGELMAIEPLLRRLAAMPHIEVALTTTTSTGLRVLQQRLVPLTVWHGIFPLDFWPFSRRAWRLLQPDLAVLMEGELWPEHIRQARARGVPVLLVNARLSDKSFARHKALRRAGRAFFSGLDGILAGSSTDQERFRDLGWVDAGRVDLTGNLKFDVPADTPPDAAARAAMLGEFGFTGGPDTTVLLGSSTWPGEEEALLRACIALRAAHPGLRLLLVPRHAERRREIEEVLRSLPVRCHFRSDARAAPGPVDVYIADTTGELRMLTRFADLVFVGKSFPPNTGGQTPVEAAALGKPLLFGPDMSNFRDISRALLRERAAVTIASADQLQAAIGRMLADPAASRDAGLRAAACIAQSRGATDRVVARIRAVLG